MLPLVSAETLMFTLGSMLRKACKISGSGTVDNGSTVDLDDWSPPGIVLD